MHARLSVALLTALLVTLSGSAAVLSIASPAVADQDDHLNHGHHVKRGPNPYGANGYWRNGAWHNRAANHPRRAGQRKHPAHQHNHRSDRDG